MEDLTSFTQLNLRYDVLHSLWSFFRKVFLNKFFDIMIFVVDHHRRASRDSDLTIPNLISEQMLAIIEYLLT